MQEHLRALRRVPDVDLTAGRTEVVWTLDSAPILEPCLSRLLSQAEETVAQTDTLAAAYAILCKADVQTHT